MQVGGSSHGFPLRVLGSTLLLPCLLRFLFEESLLQKSLLESLPADLLGPTLEYLILGLVEDGKGGLMASLHGLCAAPYDLRRLYLRSMVKVARSLEASQAAWLFTHATPVTELFDECIREADVEMAAMFLLLRMAIGEAAEAIVDLKPLLHLLELALEAPALELIGDLNRLVETFGQTDISVEARELFVRWSSSASMTT